MPVPFGKRDKYSTPEINEAKQIRDAAQKEHKIAKLREKAATKRNKSAHMKEKAAMYRKKAAKSREMSLIYKEEAEQLEAQAKELERSLKPIYADDRRGGSGYQGRDERSSGYGGRDSRSSRDYRREDEYQY
jgi:hypothetical protein